MALIISMRFSYVDPKYNDLGPGDWRRPEIKSKTTYDAILAGERVATTRVPMWYKNKPEQLAAIKALKPGDRVIITAPKRQSFEVEVKPSTLSEKQMLMAEHYPQLQGLCGATYAISLAKLRANPQLLETWSQLEGWKPEVGIKLLTKEPLHYGYQFQFGLI